MIKETFDSVVTYQSDIVGKVYILHLGIKDFSEKFNVPIKYLDPVPQTSAFEPLDIGVYINLKGDVKYQDGTLDIVGDAVLFDGKVKLERRMHPETDVIVRIFDNLSDDQIISFLKPIKN